ncbi:MAG: hypothetical protein IJW68_02630 [Bacteroidaceae bacterium]|nr:hypothetical protein [Bacteroidaceae bacterium]
MNVTFICSTTQTQKVTAENGQTYYVSKNITDKKVLTTDGKTLHKTPGSSSQ